ncbi:alpha/beta hydrolase fold-domain-containing protein [Cladochytrium replicatum]|nr:alpha/beta hydrolase fold-domain-containing protein [Cladochytrium replicatum]
MNVLLQDMKLDPEHSTAVMERCASDSTLVAKKLSSHPSCYVPPSEIAAKCPPVPPPSTDGERFSHSMPLPVHLLRVSWVSASAIASATWTSLFRLDVEDGLTPADRSNAEQYASIILRNRSYEDSIGTSTMHSMSDSATISTDPIPGPNFRAQRSLLTNIVHAAMKSAMITHPPQGRHSMGIVRFATSFSIPGVAVGARVHVAPTLKVYGDQLDWERVMQHIANVIERTSTTAAEIEGAPAKAFVTELDGSAVAQTAPDIGDEADPTPIQPSRRSTRHSLDSLPGVSPVPVSRELSGEWVVHKDVPASRLEDISTPVVLYLHGGAHIFMSPRTHRSITARISHAVGGPLYALDYRLCPEHVFPSAIEDALSAYMALIGWNDNLMPDCPVSSSFADVSSPTYSAAWKLWARSEEALHPIQLPVTSKRIVIMGDSSGGCLTIQLLQAIKVLGLPMPAGSVLLSPFIDHERKGWSWDRNWQSDFMSLDKQGVDWALKVYSGAYPIEHPWVSPINGNLAGLPPMLIQAGEAEVLTDDAVRLQYLATEIYGIDARLELYAGMFHVFHAMPAVLVSGATDEAMRRLGLFVSECMAITERATPVVILQEDEANKSILQQSTPIDTPQAVRLTVRPKGLFNLSRANGITPGASPKDGAGRILQLPGRWIGEVNEFVHTLIAGGTPPPPDKSNSRDEDASTSESASSHLSTPLPYLKVTEQPLHLLLSTQVTRGVRRVQMVSDSLESDSADTETIVEVEDDDHVRTLRKNVKEAAAAAAAGFLNLPKAAVQSLLKAVRPSSDMKGVENTAEKKELEENLIVSRSFPHVTYTVA